ncbi:hypothetical protein C499_15570 [Halogeometricum borinquense DSM 11551]|uniref:Uncharacterized protein n=2 Tax=Halogeometricum borinquense TaxID=60847 RepID=E4NSN3_HALBP|nr:hypothetical protein [Halogeometricum borinquense]ADQ68126.1 hypothetical protein Hbor_25730 [Halogeometricum borinquense DSM 11551]ELY24830.1 hypothetical protein C499_15570 [Halogeometricum borinquense DSM 11551]RYJ12969.1 hypothetical protein ELS19_02615 [Halogeometricum borinquense]
MTEITRRPATQGVLLSLVAATVGFIGITLAAAGAAAPAAVGVVVLAVGLFRASRRLVTLGATALFLGIVYAGVLGGVAELLLLGTLGAVVSWDAGEYAIGVGEQLGRDADTTRLTVVHSAATLLVGIAGTAVVYAVFLAVGGGQPVAALVLVLLGATALVAALRGNRDTGRQVRRGR